MRVRRRHHAARRVAIALVLALAALGARPSPVASGPRPPLLLGDGLADPWEAPGRHAGADFTTLPYDAVDGRQGSWLLSSQRLPLEVVLEQEVIDRFGLEALTQALTVWNDVDGSRFAIEITGTTSTGADRKRRDGISRVFLARTDCDGDYLARAHLHPGQVVERNGALTNFFWEADIGICPRMGPDRLGSVLRHEVAHVAGLGHLCDPGDECWLPGTGQHNRCRLMFPAAYSCQEPTTGDELGFIHQYPTLPRLRSPTAGAGTAAASRFAYERQRGVDDAVLVAADAAPRLQVEAAHLAGLRGVPVLVVDDACTEGPAGDELNRVLAVHADVTLVGEIGGRCATELSGGWGLEVQQLSDHEALLEALTTELGRPSVAYVVSEEDDALADAVLALPAALRRGALLLRADEDGLTAASRQLLEDVPSVRLAIVVGSARNTTQLVEADAAELGLSTERIEAGYRAATSLSVWGDLSGVRAGRHEVLLTSGDRDALVATAAVAAATRWPVLLTPAHDLDEGIALELRARASGGLIVGDERALTDLVQVSASRAADDQFDSASP